MLWFVTMLAAFACPNLELEVARAHQSYNQGNDLLARAIVRNLYEKNNLACQPNILRNEQLLELYRMDAQLSQLLNDKDGMLTATLRTIAAQHENSAPPPSMGQTMQQLHAEWVATLMQSSITIAASTDSIQAWADGRPFSKTQPLTTVKGIHLIQILNPNGSIIGHYVTVNSHLIVSANGTLTTVGSEAQPPAPETPAITKRVRKRPAWVFVAAGTLTAAGSGLLVWAAAGEKQWKEQVYYSNIDAQPGMSAGELTNLRKVAIVKDANRINGVYAAGYSAIGAGVVLTGIGIVGIPGKSKTTTVTLSGRF